MGSRLALPSSPPPFYLSTPPPLPRAAIPEPLELGIAGPGCRAGKFTLQTSMHISTRVTKNCEVDVRIHTMRESNTGWLTFYTGAELTCYATPNTQFRMLDFTVLRLVGGSGLSEEL